MSVALHNSLTSMTKLLAQWEVYRLLRDVPGDIVECGVFRGDSLLHWAMFRQTEYMARRLIAFDTFGKFPEATYEPDREPRSRFLVKQGDMSSSAQEIHRLLREHGCAEWVELIEGDIRETVPRWAMGNPWVEMALLNLDVDLYEPAVVALEHFWPMMSPGGIVICDNYDIFPGETRAVQEHCCSQSLRVRELDLFPGCYYIQKDRG